MARGPRHVLQGGFADLLPPSGALKGVSVQNATQSAVVSLVGSEHKTALRQCS